MLEFLRAVSAYFRQPDNSKTLQQRLAGVFVTNHDPNPIWKTVFAGLLRLDEIASDENLQRMVFVQSNRRRNGLSPQADFSFKDEILILDTIKDLEGNDIIVHVPSLCATISRNCLAILDDERGEWLSKKKRLSETPDSRDEADA